MLEYELNTQYLEHADILKDTTFFDDIESNNNNTDILNNDIKNTLNFKNENNVLLYCSSASILLVVLFNIYLIAHNYNTFNKIDIIFSFMASIVLGMTSGLLSSLMVVTFKLVTGKLSRKYKKLTQLVKSLKDEQTLNYKNLNDYLAQKDNQHQALKEVSHYYEVIVQQCGLEFTETLGYVDLRDTLINDFIIKNPSKASETIQHINQLIRRVPHNYSQWTEARNYKKDYQQFLKTDDTLDAFENNDAIHLKRII